MIPINDEILEELVDREVKAITALEWLKGYFEGVDGDHEAAASRVETALDALKGGTE